MNDTVYKKLFKIEKFAEWDRLIQYYLDHRQKWSGWVFRGQSCSNWGLETRLERSAHLRFKEPLANLPRIEKGLRRKFMRQLHNYTPRIPKDNERIEWLSIMQHHGAPTRLLDCTYSFFVALFFAIEVVKPGDSCAVWAFDAGWLGEQARLAVPKTLKKPWVTKDPKVVNKILWRRSPIPLVYPDNPFFMNQRLAVQQGVFLVPGDITRPFAENLKALAKPPKSKQHLVKLEIDCSIEFLVDALHELYRMKLDAETLFPGLDGFARHLEMLIAVPASRWADSTEVAT
jgi:hypothetical protein